MSILLQESTVGGPLCLGDIRMDLPVVQAALSGYSDWPMRAVAREMGAPYSISEVAIDAFVANPQDPTRTRHQLMYRYEGHTHGRQLTGLHW